MSGASSYASEVSPLALRGITTASVNLWIDRKSFVPDRCEVIDSPVFCSGTIVSRNVDRRGTVLLLTASVPQHVKRCYRGYRQLDYRIRLQATIVRDPLV